MDDRRSVRIGGEGLLQKLVRGWAPCARGHRARGPERRQAENRTAFGFSSGVRRGRHFLLQQRGRSQQWPSERACLRSGSETAPRTRGC